MSLAVINLPTNKTESTVSDHVRKIGQGEKGLTLEVIVMDADSSGYDLTNKIITFSENKVGGKIVVDSAKENFERLNDTAGRFRYKLADSVYAASGEAWFSISTPSGDVIDTTKSFNIDVIEDATIHINNDNYVSTLTALETHYKSIIQRTEDDNAALLAKFNQQIKDAVDNGNNNIQQVIDSADKLIAQWEQELTNDNQALNRLLNDWQTQTSQINADYESQKKAIQNDADSQLVDNKKAADDAIAKIESDKQTAIDQANSDFKSKLDSIQSDYNSWKTTTIADFQKQLDELKQELKDDEDAQSSIRDAIKAANNAISKINDVDFTQYVKKDDFNAALAKINTLGTPVEVDNKTNPDSLTEPGFYFSKNGLSFDKSKIPDGYRIDGKTYVAVLEGDNPDNSINYYQQFMFQATKFSYECWYRAGYQYGTNAYYTVSFTNLKDIYGPLKQISINGGTPVSPDSKGIANLTIPAPDFSPLEAEINKRPLTVNNIAPDSKGNVNVPIPDVSGIKNDIQNMQNQITSNALSAMKSWTGTLSQYQALTSYDPMTMYFIISDYEVVVK